MSAILPISVSIPVVTTIACPRPEAMTVPVKSIFNLSPIVASGLIGSVFLYTGWDSPVSAASSTCSLTASIRRASAGTLLPDSTKITSPGTMSLVAISISSPERITLAFGDDSSFKESIVLWALDSWIKPITALENSTKIITTAFVVLPTKNEIKAATSRI